MTHIGNAAITNSLKNKNLIIGLQVPIVQYFELLVKNQELCFVDFTSKIKSEKF
jgi:hypothetical protein